MLFINFQIRTLRPQLSASIKGVSVMRAIVITRSGGPEVLAIEERPDPRPAPGEVLIEVKAFGVNHAEVYFRKGVWGAVAEISGIECVGLVKADRAGVFSAGQK